MGPSERPVGPQVSGVMKRLGTPVLDNYTALPDDQNVIKINAIFINRKWLKYALKFPQHSIW